MLQQPLKALEGARQPHNLPQQNARTLALLGRRARQHFVAAVAAAASRGDSLLLLLLLLVLVLLLSAAGGCCRGTSYFAPHFVGQAAAAGQAGTADAGEDRQKMHGCVEANYQLVLEPRCRHGLSILNVSSTRNGC